MKHFFIFLLACLSISDSYAQKTFKAGWNTYSTGYLIHEYTYAMQFQDTLKLSQTDSTIIYCTADSLVRLTVSYQYRQKDSLKTLNIYNSRKLLIRTEEYKNELLLCSKDWKYDDKDRQVLFLTDNKSNGNTYKKLYDYSTDKKGGDLVVSESSYINGRIEFYTKGYINKQNQKYKEVRLNDNNKDIVHVETFTYGDNGKLKLRSVYFPEWKVTKNFDEYEGTIPVKCFSYLPMVLVDKITIPGRVAFMRKLLVKNKALFNDAECHEFDYKFTNKFTCEVEVLTTKVNNGRNVIFKYKERVL